MQAPANVLVVWSKISIAEAVPVMLTEAVAVSRTLSPARGDERSADSERVVDGGAAGAPRAGGEGRVVSSQAAGELSSDFAGSAGHCVRPSGRND
jgi:hypothetical protein